MSRQLARASAVLFTSGAARAADLEVYDPGGSMPAMKEAAEAFGRQMAIDVAVTTGPTSACIGRASTDGYVVFSGPDAMMTDFVSVMNGRIRSEDVEPPYLRRAAILMRPGNPKKSTGAGRRSHRRMGVPLFMILNHESFGH